MTIGVDIRLLSKNKSSGIEEYTKNILAHMIPLARNVKFKLFYSGIKDTLIRYSWMEADNVELFYKRVPNKVLFATSRFVGQPYLDQIIKGADVFFSPHFYITSLSSECRRVVTFHDLSFLHHPQFFSFDRNIWNTLQMNPKVRRTMPIK